MNSRGDDGMSRATLRVGETSVRDRKTDRNNKSRAQGKKNDPVSRAGEGGLVRGDAEDFWRRQHPVDRCG